MHERYGHDRAALVAAFPTFRARGAIRELGKVLGLPPGEIERVARGAERYGSGAEHERSAGRARQLRRAGGDGAPRVASLSAGAGSRAWSSRPTACRATSPSTRAG